MCFASSARVSTNVVYMTEDTVEKPTRFASSVLVPTNCPQVRGKNCGKKEEKCGEKEEKKRLGKKGE